MKFKMSKYMYAIQLGILPKPLANKISNNNLIHAYHTRNANHPHILARRTQLASKGIKHLGPSVWYTIPANIRESKTIGSFNTLLKKYILQKYSPF